jgi:hypothetical protein
MKKLIGFLLIAVLVGVAGSAYAAELGIGTRLYTKFLDRNTYDPTLYRTTGNGVGIRSELELTLDGRVSDRAEMGARILTVWAPPGISPDYSDWGGWFDGGANLWQVRGMWLRFYPATLPTVKSVLIGSTDLGMFNAWTIGKIRWIDRDNARIIYAEGQLGGMKYGLGATPMPSWWGPGWSTGPNPRKVWAYGASLSGAPNQALNLKLTGSRVLSQQQDPTTTDDTQGVNRYDNMVGTLEFLFTPNPVLNLDGLVGFSNYSADTALIGPSMGWWPHIPYDDVSGLALKLTATANDPFNMGLTLKGEYFDVAPDFVSIMAARRETNVLLSEGHVRYGADVNGSTWDGNVGFTPSAHVDNGITDWNETYYYNIIGTNGFTLVPEFRRGPLGIKGEVSYTSNKLNSQDVDTTKYFWAAPRIDQSGMIYSVRADYLTPIGLNIFGKYKLVTMSDGVNTSIDTDNMSMNDTEIYGGVSLQLTDELGVTGGYKSLNYVNEGNGLDEDVTTYELNAGMLFAEVKYNVGGVDIGMAWEKVNGEEDVSGADVDDMRFKGTVEVKI